MSFTPTALAELRALQARTRAELARLPHEHVSRLNGTRIESAAPSAVTGADLVRGDWTELPIKVAGAYLRAAESRPRPLWFHAVGVAALVCAATRPIWCTAEKETR